MFAIIENGAVAQIVHSLDGYELATSVALPEAFDPEIHRWDVGVGAGAMVVDCCELDSQLKAQVNAARAELTGDRLTGAKDFIYAAKLIEARGYSGLSVIEKTALSDADAKSEFPFLWADKEAFGDSLADALARFQDGIAANIHQIAGLEAAYQKAVKDIAEAGDAEAKRAVGIS